MTTELLECLEDWGKHFIETRNPAGLAVLRAKTTIKNQSDRIGELLEAVERGNECREMLKRCELWLSTAPEGRKMQLECQRVLSQHNVEVSHGDRERQPDTHSTHNQP